MLIIEGADNLGKTTACKRLVELAASDGVAHEYPIRYQHMSRPNHHFDFFNDYQDMISRYAVQDRFHIGALAWHDKVLPLARLRIVEGWLAAQGSLVCVLVASDEKWYREHLKSQPKQEMFSIDRILEGNKRFLQNDARQDYTYDVSIHGFLTDKMLWQILREWFSRLENLGRFP